MSTKKSKKNGTDTVQVPNFNLKKIEAKTENQQETIDAYLDGYNLLLHGVAGTGKSYLALWLGLHDIFSGKFKKLIIIRSIVPSRDMGFLPGSVQEKAAMYETPYQAICSELFERGDAYEILKKKEIIEFISTSHLRGTTLHDAIVLIEEIQNMNFQELDTVITRIGDGCRVLLSGDIEQTDLNKPHDHSGLPEFIKIIDEVWDEDHPEFSFVSIEFGPEDIVRSGIVRGYIRAKADLGLSQFLRPDGV